MNPLFNEISYFYVGIFVITGIFCLLIKTIEVFTTTFFLGLLYFVTLIDSWWNSPETMAVIHLVILICVALSLYGDMAKKMVLLTLGMVIVDMLWVVMPDLNLLENYYEFPYSYFWWQSSVNIIYFSMCVFTIHGFRRELKQNKENKGGYNGSLLAFAINKISHKDLV